MPKTVRKPGAARQMRGDAASNALWLAIGRILSERAAIPKFDPSITIAELARASGLSRPSVYKRSDVVVLLDKLATMASPAAADAEERTDQATLSQQQARHDAELVRIASEKMKLLARISDLEERLERASARSSFPTGKPR